MLREGLLSPAILSARLQCAVLDEADLLLSYGYEEDLALIAPAVRPAHSHPHATTHPLDAPSLLCRLLCCRLALAIASPHLACSWQHGCLACRSLSLPRAGGGGLHVS